MSDKSIVINTPYYLNLTVLNVNGKGQTGLTVTYAIYLASTNALVTSGTLTQGLNGLYYGSYTFTSEGQYYINYTTPAGYTNEMEIVIVEKEHAKAENLLRLLGLSDEYKRIVNPVYNSAGNLLSATVRIFSNVTDYDNNTNPIATYEMLSTYNVDYDMTSFGVKRVS